MRGRVAAAGSERRHLSSENSDKASEISDAMRLVRLAAGPREVNDSVKLAINRAARSLRWTPTRTRDLWYGTARRIDAGEMDALRVIERRHAAAQSAADRRQQVEQLAALRARLATRDPEFHRADIAALDWLLAEVGRS